MKIENIRSSFMIYILDVHRERSRSLQAHLEDYDYLVKSFATLEDVLGSIPEDPPHVLYVHSDLLEKSDLGLQYIFDLSPETRIVILSDTEKSRKTNYNIVHDVVVSSLLGDGFSLEQIKALQDQMLAMTDRISELNYYMYMNEQLREQQSVSDQNMDFSLFSIWSSSLQSARTKSDAIDGFMSEVSRHHQGEAIVFYKFAPAYQSLVSSKSLGLSEFKKGEIYKLNLDEIDLLAQGQSTKHHLESFKLCNYKELEQGLFFIPLIIHEELAGVFVVGNEKALTSSYVRSCRTVLKSVLEKIELHKDLAKERAKDPASLVWSRENFLHKMGQEVARVRRIEHPVSLLILSLDQYGVLKDQLSPTERESIFRTLDKVILETGRSYDVVGRISENEWALLLPHTSIEGAALKAERLRDIISRVQFTKLNPKASMMTVSLGASEYPSRAADSSDLLTSADVALIEAKTAGGNKIGVADLARYFESEISSSDLLI